MKKFVATMAVALLMATNFAFAAEFPVTLESGQGKVEFSIEKAESDVITLERTSKSVIVAEKPFRITTMDESNFETGIESKVATAEDAKLYNIKEGDNFFVANEEYLVSFVADGKVTVNFEYNTPVAPNVRFNSYNGLESLFLDAQEDNTVQAEVVGLKVNGVAVGVDSGNTTSDVNVADDVIIPVSNTGSTEVGNEETTNVVVTPPIDPSLLTPGSDVVFGADGFVVANETDLNLINQLTAESMAASTGPDGGALPATGGVGAGAILTAGLGLIGIGSRKRK